MTTNKERANRAAWDFARAAFARGAWPSKVQPRDIPPTMKRLAGIFDSKECFDDRFGESGSLEVALALSLVPCLGAGDALSADNVAVSAFREARRLNESELLSPEEAKRSRALECEREAEAEKRRLASEATEARRREEERRATELEKERREIERERESLNA